MPPPPTDDAPSGWFVLNDFTKTIITLSSALFALSVTFSANLLGKTTAEYQIVLLVASWVGLALSIAFGVASQGLLINYLRVGKNGGATVGCANLSFLLVSVSVLLFLAFALATFNGAGNSTSDVLSALPKARDAVRQASGISTLQMKAEFATSQEREKTIEYLFSTGVGGDKYRVTWDASTGKAIRIVKEEAVAPVAAPKLSVSDVQSRLLQLGYVVGPIDGIVGTKTAAAIRRFQLNRGLPVTGTIDAATTIALAPTTRSP
ncbi:hypothetical protein AYM40_21365 [Paraburkholderia phytofirmans OLGA172]|uniref:Peptidoglycan binding-like domain-containing protein n=1 Tax=Paraburkholderia phytofirmans OLGA172 TaxID=1417228 RepID=A0A160FQZ2_9BURK|nr:peptidoglycan-binding domain-containing protein [Paraburkholderia phytofirmans]ANB74986.1 hypothetical protein AYM40_21365 [Paraburkholderia phytofirmans OLGA172]